MSSPERRSRVPIWRAARPARCCSRPDWRLCRPAPCSRSIPTPAVDPTSAVTGSIGAELSTIAVKPVTTRVGQEVRNHLIFLFNGGKGEPAAPRYTLDLAVAAVSEATANIQVNEENEPTAAILTAAASYRLIDSTGKMVASGKRQFAASYDVPRQEFAAFRAQRDAENRAARELAELLRLAIAQDLARGPPPPADGCNPSRTDASALRDRQPIFWPVLAQSARNVSSPLSVSGCLTSAFSVAGGTVATSAPISAACLTWFTVRIEAARISVWKS